MNSLYDWLGDFHYDYWILHRSVDEMPMPDLGTTDQEFGEHLLIPLPFDHIQYRSFWKWAKIVQNVVL